MTPSPPPLLTHNAEPGTSAACSVSPLLAAPRHCCFATHPAIQDQDPERLALIRSFFLEPQSSYTFAGLASLWQVSVAVVRDIYEDRYTADGPDAGPSKEARVPWHDAARTSITFNFLRPYDVERALDAEFSSVCSEEWKTIPLVIRLPRLALRAVAARPSLRPDAAVPLQVEQFVLEMLLEERRGRNT